VIRSSGHLVIGEPKPHPPEARRRGRHGEEPRSKERNTARDFNPGIESAKSLFFGVDWGRGWRAQRANRRHRTSSPTSGNRVNHKRREGTQRERVIGEPKPHPPEARRHGNTENSQGRKIGTQPVTRRAPRHRNNLWRSILSPLICPAKLCKNKAIESSYKP
jgi:hypothetical protein